MQQSDISAVSASQGHIQMTMNNPRLYFSRKQRLLSLDVFRGTSVLLMIFVTYIGSTWPVLDTSPWNGLQLGDVIQPFFLFAVGISIVLSMNKYRKKSKIKAFTHAIIRFIKLFIIGLLTEGGKDIANYNMKQLRIFGILQRIAICYIIGIILELYLPPLFRFDIALTPTNSSLNISREFIVPKDKHKSNKLLLSKQKRADIQSQILSPSVLFKAEQDQIGWTRRFMQSFSVFRMYQWHWIITILLLILYCVIIYGIATPNIAQFNEGCGKDILTPACNAISYVDKKVLGEKHMYFPNNSDDISFQRMRECSSCYPGKCPKEDRESWCDEAPFEPYGITSTFTAIVMTLFGMHVAHVFTNFSERKVRIFHLISVGIIQGIFGILLDMSTYNEFNASLYSISYLFLTCALATVIFSILYFIMDSKLFVYRFKKLYGKYKHRRMAKRHLTNYYVSPQFSRNDKMDKLYQYVSSQLIADVIEENDEYKEALNEENKTQNEENNGKVNGDNMESKSALMSDSQYMYNKSNSIVRSNKSILTSNKSSTMQSLTGSDKLYRSDLNDSEEDIETCCPWWCCCCCEDLPCTRWDWSIVNILDKLIFLPLESLGRNAFVIYIFAVTNVSSWFLSMFYWDDTKQCLTNIIWPNGIYYGPTHGMEAIDWRYSKEMMLWTVAYCLFWTLVAVFLHHKKWYYVI